MIKYLSEKQVIFINALLIKRYTPKEQIGVKEIGLLQRALARPKQTILGEDVYPHIFEKAAVLYASIIQNHPFFNGNKRTGFATVKQFLWINGYRLIVDEDEAVEYTVKIATDKPDIKVITSWIQRHSESREQS